MTLLFITFYSTPPMLTYVMMNEKFCVGKKEGKYVAYISSEI